MSNSSIVSRHCINFEIHLKKAKRDFDERWSRDLKPNASFNDFKLQRTLGMGSFGRVILVNKRINKDEFYAIKVLEKEHIIKSRQLQHTISEVRIMDAIKFEFIVYMEYFFKDNVYLFIVMPFYGGGEMFTRLRIMRKFEESVCKFYAAQVVLGLEYMHYVGLVYRDLKPENILIDVQGYLKLADLGFCKKIDNQRTYTLCGTPEYLAPEIILSQGYNDSVDWWALGILIFEMNAGFPPFSSKEPMKIYEKIVSGNYQTPSFFSPILKDILNKILQVDRTRRYGVLRNGVKDIKFHEWFKDLDWDAVLTKKIKPRYKPTMKGHDDTSNFDRYEEKPLKTSAEDKYPQEFENFNVQ